MPKAFYMDIDKYERTTNILRVFGHPMCLIMVRELITKSLLNVSELQTLLRIPQTRVSQ